MLKYGSVVCVFLFFNYSNAQQIETDRPDQTESSSTVPKRSLQIESGIYFEKSDLISHSETQLLLPTSLFRIGITKGFELRILSQFEQFHSKTSRQNGISDLEVGTKIQLFKRETSRTEIAILSHLLVPTGSNGLTNSAFGSISKLCVSHELTDFSEIGYNIGYNYFGTGTGDLTYSLAYNFDLNGKIGLYVEPFGEIVDLKDWISNFDAGFTYLVQDNLQLDFSFGTGINHRLNYLSIGLSWVSKPRN